MDTQIVHIAGEKQGTAFTTYVALRSQSTGGIQASPTLEVGDVKVIKDSGSPSNIVTLPSETANHTGTGILTVSLTADEMNADCVLVKFSDAAGAEWSDLLIVIHTKAVTISELVRATAPANTLDVAATGEVGLDFSNLKLPGSPTTLTNIVVPLVNVTESVNHLGLEAITDENIAPGALTAGHFDSGVFKAILDFPRSSLNQSSTSGFATSLLYILDRMEAFLGLTGATTGRWISNEDLNEDLSHMGYGRLYNLLFAIALGQTPGSMGMPGLLSSSGWNTSKHGLKQIGDQAAGIGYTSGNTVITRLGSLASAVSTLTGDVYSARIDYTIDEGSSQDEWTVVPYRNGAPLSATSVRIGVTKRSDGSALFALTSMSQVGSTKFWKLNATGGNRAAAGEALCVTVEITDGSSVVEVQDIKGRDA